MRVIAKQIPSPGGRVSAKLTGEEFGKGSYVFAYFKTSTMPPAFLIRPFGPPSPRGKVLAGLPLPPSLREVARRIRDGKPVPYEHHRKCVSLRGPQARGNLHSKIGIPTAALQPRNDAFWGPRRHVAERIAVPSPFGPKNKGRLSPPPLRECCFD